MDLKGDIEFVYTPNQRLIMYLILVSRLSNGESFSHFQNKFVACVETALGYLSNRLLDIIFCAYDCVPIRESIWSKINNYQISLWGRTLSLVNILHSLQYVSFFLKTCKKI